MVSSSDLLRGVKMWWVECLPKVRETWVKSQVPSYQRLLKWYLILPYLTLNNDKVEQFKERSCTLPLRLGVVAIEKRTFGSPLTTIANIIFTHNVVNI